MLKLYYLEEADSICSNRVLMTLAEKGIDDWIPQKLVLLNRDQFKPVSYTHLTLPTILLV